MSTNRNSAFLQLPPAHRPLHDFLCRAGQVIRSLFARAHGGTEPSERSPRALRSAPVPRSSFVAPTNFVDRWVDRCRSFDRSPFALVWIVSTAVVIFLRPDGTTAPPFVLSSFVVSSALSAVSSALLALPIAFLLTLLWAFVLYLRQRRRRRSSCSLVP